MLALENEVMVTRQGTLALVNIGVYRSSPGAQRAAMLSMAIPLFPGMTEADQDRVVDAIRRHTSG